MVRVFRREGWKKKKKKMKHMNACIYAPQVLYKTPNSTAQVRELGRGRVDLTIGSALDIFGGNLPYSEVVRWQRQEEGSKHGS